jgi:hypothetical protein
LNFIQKENGRAVELFPASYPKYACKLKINATIASVLDMKCASPGEICYEMNEN